jgi:hypothetical protein
VITISDAHNQARLNASLSHMITGAARPKLRIYGGTRPSNGAAPGTPLLVEIELNPTTAAVANGVLSIAQFAPGLIENTGLPTWARIVNGAGAHSLDCDAAGPGGTAEVLLSTESLYQGGQVILSSATFA